jgi:spermidine synthase
VIGFARSLFPTVRYAAASVPTYPSGQIGFVVCSLDANHDVTTPVRRPREGSVEYWSEEVHRAMFVLPKFAEKALAASS